MFKSPDSDVRYDNATVPHFDKMISLYEHETRQKFIVLEALIPSYSDSNPRNITSKMF